MNHLAVAQGIPIVPDGPDRVLTFASVTPSTRFASNRYRIDEPVIPAEECITARALDVVLMPLVAFDGQGNRVGMGCQYQSKSYQKCRSKSYQLSH